MKKLLLAAALLPAFPAAATQAGPRPRVFSPVIVTATRTAITVDEALASVTVITRADIDRLQPLSLSDLLEGLPGISFARAGGLGQQTSLFLRGTNSAHTLLLIDGVRVGTVSAGLPAFEQLPLDQIERIEVVRGPRASLYGADALGGVIQIFTRHGGRDGALQPSLRAGVGSRGYRDGQAGLAGGSENGWYNFSIGRQRTEGINACRPGAAEAFAGCFVDEPDRDGYRNGHALANLGWRWGESAELAATFLRSISRIAYDGAPYGNQAHNLQQVAGLRLRLEPTATWSVTLAGGQSLDGSHVYNDGVFLRYSDSRRDQVSWQNDLALAADHLLSLGLDWQREHLASDTGYLASTRNDTGAFAQYQGHVGRQGLELSIRHDHNQQFGGHTTGAAAWGYRFDHGTRLSASWGSAFHAPTFNDLYYPYGLGNPALAPETSRSFEFGLEHERDHWHWALHGYRTRVGQLITLGADYFPRNIARARIRGLEAELGARLEHWQWRAFLTLQQPENRSGPAAGHRLPRRPERMARVELDRSMGPLAFGATFEASGDRYDDLANVHRLGGYATTDLRASYRLPGDWTLEARLANVFDRRYETAYYFNQPGRSVYLTVRYSPSF